MPEADWFRRVASLFAAILGGCGAEVAELRIFDADGLSLSAGGTHA